MQKIDMQTHNNFKVRAKLSNARSHMRIIILSLCGTYIFPIYRDIRKRAIFICLLVIDWVIYTNFVAARFGHFCGDRCLLTLVVLHHISSSVYAKMGRRASGSDQYMKLQRLKNQSQLRVKLRCSLS